MTAQGRDGHVDDLVFKPVRALPYWDTLEPAVLPAVRATSRVTGRDPSALFPPAAAFALWAWQSRGIEPETAKIFRRGLVEEFVHLGMMNYTRSSRATYRSALVAIVEAITPAGQTRFPIPRSTPTAPYSTTEVAGLRSWALRQGSVRRRRDATVLLGLGLGAGLSTRELLSVRGTDVDWREEKLHVLVWESRPRLVPVLQQWTGPLLDAVAEGPRDGWLFRPGRQGVRSAQVTDFLHRGQQTDLDVRPARMRTTWLLGHLTAGTPPRELLHIAGLENLAALDRITRFLPGRTAASPRS